MSPDDFLVLATRLSASPGEAELRSAVSRAYYGLFHTARLLIEACDVSCPESGEAHDKIAKCLQNSQSPDVAAAGSKLNSFRTVRNHADYRLSDERFKNAKFIAIQLAIAREIADALGIDATFIRSPLRNYARDVLKLAVRGTD
jgi:uncharacterized protein (UPF0332 family)